MSEFSLALEQAERDRVARQGATPTAPRPPSEAAPRPSDGAPRPSPRVVPSPDVRPLSEAEQVEPARAAPGYVRSRTVDPKFVSLLAPTSLEADQYRMLAHFVQDRVGRRTTARDAGVVIAITSPRAREGKTTTAVNLAGALAQSARTRVLLLDADLRRSDLIERLGLGHVDGRTLGHGLQQRGVGLDALVYDCPQYDLSVLPAGPPIPSPYDFLAAPRLGELFDEARGCFGYVIVDTPGFAPWPDARAITAVSDGVLLVVAAHRTSRRGAHEMARWIGPAKLMGVVLNRDDELTYAEPARGSRTRDRRRAVWGRR